MGLEPTRGLPSLDFESSASAIPPLRLEWFTKLVDSLDGFNELGSMKPDGQVSRSSRRRTLPRKFQGSSPARISNSRGRLCLAILCSGTPLPLFLVDCALGNRYQDCLDRLGRFLGRPGGAAPVSVNCPGRGVRSVESCRTVGLPGDRENPRIARCHRSTGRSPGPALRVRNRHKSRAWTRVVPPW